MHRALFAVLTFLLVPAFSAFSQDTSTDETRREIPALTEFHTVIYQMWHTAWPEKNVGMLVDLLPDVEKLGGDLVAAQLPGIYRDKAEKWRTQIAALKETMGEYRAATAPVDSQKLMNAAEKLHMQYEKLVRTLRPVLKELDDFHVSLYVLYHHQMPGHDLEGIRKSASELQMKMDSLNRASLPARLKGKEEAFVSARKELTAGVNGLAEVLPSGDFGVIGEKLEILHGRYQALEKILE